jgi:hypothetical protein
MLYWLLEPSTSQQEAETRHTLTTEPFLPILKVLADVERDGPKFAFSAARLVGLYRRLWESCVSKNIDGQKLQQSNQILKQAGTHLLNDKNGLRLRHDKQLPRLRFFERGLESSRGRLTRVLDDWRSLFQTQSGRAAGHGKRRVKDCIFWMCGKRITEQGFRLSDLMPADRVHPRHEQQHREIIEGQRIEAKEWMTCNKDWDHQAPSQNFVEIPLLNMFYQAVSISPLAKPEGV